MSDSINLKCLKCPKCGSSLLAEDIHVNTDLVLCRFCNQIGKFSDIVHEVEYSGVLDKVPDRIMLEKTIRGLEMSYKRPKAEGLFFMVFTVFWNGIVSIAAFSVWSKKEGAIFDKFFLIPFFLIGLATLVVAIYSLFGRVKLTLNAGKGELFRGVGILGRRQQFQLVRDARISIEESGIRQNGRMLNKIVVEQPAGKPFEFGTVFAKDEEHIYVVALLRLMRE